MNIHSPYDITHRVFLFFPHVSILASLAQIKAIYSQPYYHMCISVSPPFKNIGIAVFGGIAVLPRFDRLSVISSYTRELDHVYGRLVALRACLVVGVGDHSRHFFESSEKKNLVCDQFDFTNADFNGNLAVYSTATNQ